MAAISSQLIIEDVSGSEDLSTSDLIQPTSTAVTTETVENGCRTVTTITETVQSVTAAPAPKMENLPTVTTQAMMDDPQVAQKLEGTADDFRRVKVRLTSDNRIICGKCAHYMKVIPRQNLITQDCNNDSGNEAEFRDASLEYEYDNGLHVHRHLHNEAEVHFHTHQVV